MSGHCKTFPFRPSFIHLSHKLCLTYPTQYAHTPSTMSFHKSLLESFIHSHTTCFRFIPHLYYYSSDNSLSSDPNIHPHIKHIFNCTAFTFSLLKQLPKYLRTYHLHNLHIQINVHLSCNPFPSHHQGPAYFHVHSTSFPRRPLQAVTFDSATSASSTRLKRHSVRSRSANLTLRSAS